MNLTNEILYLSVALITLGMIFPAYLNLKNSNHLFNSSVFWFLALCAQFLSSLFFACYGIFGPKMFTLGSTFQTLVDVMLIFLFRSLNQNVTKKFLLFPLLVLLFYYSFYNQEDYIHRTIISASTLIILSIWQIVELAKALKKSWSIYIIFMIVMIFIQITFGAMRLHEGIDLIPLHETSSAPLNRFEESNDMFMERLFILLSYVLLLMGIGNHFFNELFLKANMKHKDLEEQVTHVLARLAAARDNGTGKHIVRTQAMMRVLANAIKDLGYYQDVLTAQNIKNMYLAAPLHDVGKVAISDEILLKPGKLTDEERVAVQKHVIIGEEILTTAASAGDNPIIETALKLAGSHHEQWNGNGYPRGLKELEIPLEGRIMSVVDVYDALTTRRCYKEGWKHEDAVEFISKNAGIQFDPIVVSAFLSVKNQFQRIAEEMQDPDIGVTATASRAPRFN